MKQILLVRHAKSSWKDAELSDFDRPLNKRGKANAPALGQVIKERGMLPDIILASSARRVKDTVEALADSSGYLGEIRYLDSFYHAEPGDYLQALHSVDDRYERVMLAGHNPGMENLLHILTGEFLPMPTAALAFIELPITHWYDLIRPRQGKLLDSWIPRW